MEYFRLDHPPDRMILCTRSNCEDIADYMEVNEYGREDFACAGHTSSERHASVLPKGVPRVLQADNQFDSKGLARFRTVRSQRITFSEN